MEPSGDWHPEVISDDAQRLLVILNASALTPRFYLAGGTGLALRYGHRRSVDFDFFSLEPFEEDALLTSLRKHEPLSVLSRAPSTLHLVVSEIKVSFLGYPYPLLFALDRYGGVDVADVRDIACMKLSAVASRGTRRDFVDLYMVAKQYSLGEILALFIRKYAGIEYNRMHLLKSLSYFEDAEVDPPLQMLTELSWSEVKEFFRRESTALL
ncbi:MAG TPA: nucleotidyl transferase AbiEii/AbiGii toxin family protein [Vicinamibacteria bacterium]|nr:nucleotidyl transferase AbiEii/AbiGii toxin family protein [Vicinamibacteria bacterium]